MREIQLNMYHALALGAVMYWLGAALTRKLPALRRFCVPAPLVGGLCFALFNTLLYASGLAVITFDETLETVFMILFFTTVGFTVSIPMLVKSGRSVMLLLALKGYIRAKRGSCALVLLRPLLLFGRCPIRYRCFAVIIPMSIYKPAK